MNLELISNWRGLTLLVGELLKVHGRSVELDHDYMDIDVDTMFRWRTPAGEGPEYDEVPLALTIEARIALRCGEAYLHGFKDPYSAMRCLRWLLLDPLERDET